MYTLNIVFDYLVYEAKSVLIRTMIDINMDYSFFFARRR